MASFLYDSFLRDSANGDVKATDTLKGMLLSNAYTPSRTGHTKRSDLTNEVTGTGYTAGGATLSLTPTLDTTNHRQDFAIANLAWPSSTITARYLAVYKSRGGASSADELVFLLDFGSDISTTAITFLVAFSTPFRWQG